MGDSAVVYRVVVETEPMKHIATARYLRKEIKKDQMKTNEVKDDKVATWYKEKTFEFS